MQMKNFIVLRNFSKLFMLRHRKDIPLIMSANFITSTGPPSVFGAVPNVNTDGNSPAPHSSSASDHASGDHNCKAQVLPRTLLDIVTKFVADNNDMLTINTKINNNALCQNVPNEMPHVNKKGSKRKYEYEPSDVTVKATESDNLRKKARPNYFLAVQISCNSTCRNLAAVQQHMLRHGCDPLEQGAIPVASLHVTLQVLSLQTETDVARAINTLEENNDKLKDLLKEPLQLTVKGLSHFRDNVVFAKLQDCDHGKRLAKIAECLGNIFLENDMSTKETKAFQPHVTLFKLSKIKRKSKKKALKKIPRHLYEKYTHCVFGRQRVTEIQLCAMLKPKTESGYYHVEHSYNIESTCAAGPVEQESACELHTDPESHVCAVDSEPGKTFTCQLNRNLIWTFSKPNA